MVDDGEKPWGAAGAKGMVIREWLWEHGIRQVDFDSLGLLTPSTNMYTWCVHLGNPKREGE